MRTGTLSRSTPGHRGGAVLLVTCNAAVARLADRVKGCAVAVMEDAPKSRSGGCRRD